MNIGCLSVTAVHDGPVCVLSAHGDLDVAGAGSFVKCAVEALATQPQRLVLDLGGLEFIDVAGGRALAEVVRAVPPGCPVIVRSASPLAHRVLSLLAPDLNRPPVSGPRILPPGEPVTRGRASRADYPADTGVLS